MLDKEIKDALNNWQLLLKEYTVPNPQKAIAQILNSFLPFIGIWILMYFSLQWSYWITLLLAVVNAFFLVRVFIIQHDCGHMSFLKSKKWNNTIGYICSLFSTLPYRYWAKMHNYHHGHTGQFQHRDMGDIKFLSTEEYADRSFWGKLGYRIYRHPIILFFIGPIVYVGLYNRVPFIYWKGWKKTRHSLWVNNLLMLAFYVLIAFVVGWKEFLLVQLPIVYLFTVIAFWFFYVQHQHEENYKAFKENWDHLLASIRGSSYYDLPKLFHWLSGNIGFHHVHHLNSKIPNYNLARCVRENPVLSKYVTSITFLESLKCMRHKLWHEESRRMISFREFDRLRRGIRPIG